MKRNDIASLILIASGSVVLAFFATQAVFSQFVTEETSVKTIDAISTDVTQPDERIFNEDAINPTVEVEIDTGGE